VLVGLLGAKAGLTATEMDCIARRLFNNHALKHEHGARAHTCATDREAAVGGAVMRG
jgi:hypothetical protein